MHRKKRLVHFYHEVSKEELYDVCTSRLADIETLLVSIKRWLKEHTEHVDVAL
ncbi:MAG: hypothetical protein WCA08_26090 [Desulfoferrobacter sp.]